MTNENILLTILSSSSPTQIMSQTVHWPQRKRLQRGLHAWLMRPTNDTLKWQLCIFPWAAQNLWSPIWWEEGKDRKTQEPVGTNVEPGVWVPLESPRVGSVENWSSWIWHGRGTWLRRSDLLGSFRASKWHSSSSIVWQKGKPIQACQTSYAVWYWILLAVLFISLLSKTFVCVKQL